MVIVLVTARYQTILSWLYEIVDSDITHIGILKQNGPTIYLYVQTSLSYHEVIRKFHQIIKGHGGMNLVYQFYSIYNGMIDYSDFLSDETKNQMKYYCSHTKDIQDFEIEQYKNEHQL
ncbi:MAG: hypothetical protein ACLUVC_10060 [Longibaculum sp.]